MSVLDCTYSQSEKNATHTGCREEGFEPDGAVGGHALFADALVATREEEADPTRAELREHVAHLLCLFPRDEFLFVAVRRADRLRDDRLLEDEVQPGHEPVVLAQRPSAGAVEDVRGWIRHGRSVLDVRVRLKGWVALVVPPTVDLHDGEGRVHRVGAVIEHERRQVRGARIII